MTKLKKKKQDKIFLIYHQKIRELLNLNKPITDNTLGHLAESPR